MNETDDQTDDLYCSHANLSNDNANRYYYYEVKSVDINKRCPWAKLPRQCIVGNLLLLLKSLALLFLLIVTLSLIILPWTFRDSDNDDNSRYRHRLLTNKNASGDFRKRLPDAIIIGVKKGGTRALLEYLRLHPSVKAPGPEIHYFDKRYHYGVHWYRDQMVHTYPWQMTLEKTPSYFVTKEAPARVYAMNPNVKLIIVVRNPVTRALSDYTQNVSKRPGMPSFEEMAFTNLSHGLVNTSWGAIKIGLYHKHIKRWLKYFPRRQMHFVDGERLIGCPANETNLVEEFLNLPTFIESKHFYINSTRRLPCLTGAHGRGPPRCLGKTKGRQHPTVSPFHYERLRTFYGGHNEKFFKIIGQKFDW